MNALTFFRWWLVWFALTVIGVAGYPFLYQAVTGHRTSILHTVALGVTGAIIVNLPYQIWRRREPRTRKGFDT